MIPQSAKPRNLTQQIVETLGLRIVSGNYSEGQRLPSEHEFGTEFDVSRPILREVTKILMAKGLVSSRARVGTRVLPRRHWSLLDPDVLRWTIASLPEDEFIDLLFDTRLVYEPGATALAAENATDEDLAAISEAYRQMEEAEDAEGLLDPDLAFHQAIMDATQNPFLAYIGSTLHTALATSIEMTSRHPDTHRLSLPRHKAIHDALMARDPKGAAEATLRLLEESRADFMEVRRRAAGKRRS